MSEMYDILKSMDQEKIKSIVMYYNEKNQITVAIEEMAELQKSLCKILLYGNDHRHDIDKLFRDISEEIADVLIMINQLIYIFGGLDEIKLFIENKIDRTINRISDKGTPNERP